MKTSSLLSRHVAGTFLLLSATLAATKISSYRAPGALVNPLESISRQILDFTGTDNPPLDEPTLHALKASSYLVRTYRKPSLQADLFIAFYAQQRAGESMHSPKHCLPGAGWEIWDHGMTDIPVKDQTFAVNRYSISHEGQRLVVLYWYQARNRIVASEYLGKILLAKDTLMQNSTAASIVRITVPDQPSAFEEARGLASQMILEVRRCFGS